MLTIASPNHYTGRRAPIRLVVLHTMETPEQGPIAEAVARAFADPARQASAHVCVDTTESVRCVDDADTAWAAPGANADGLQLEHAGRASQDAAQWADADSQAILERGAQQVAAWCAEHGIPAVRLSDAQLAGGARGIVDHWAVTRVYQLSDHTDAGPDFPWDAYLARVQAILAAAAAPAPAPAPRQPVTHVRLVVDGVWGPRTKARLQQWLGVYVDSQVGPVTVRALQHAVGAVVDGVWGPATTRALQHLVGANVDGSFGPLTVKALQAYLDAH